MMMSNGRIRKPRKAIKPDGKMARQMLMGMALGCHVMSKMADKIKFMIKTRLEAQVLLVLMAPFLAIPAAILAIPAACMCFGGMIVAGVSSNMTRLNALQQFMDRQQFHKLERQNTKRIKAANAAAAAAAAAGFGRSNTTSSIGSSGSSRSAGGLLSSVTTRSSAIIGSSSSSHSSTSSYDSLMNKPSTARITRRTLPRRSHTFTNGSTTAYERVRFR